MNSRALTIGSMLLAMAGTVWAQSPQSGAWEERQAMTVNGVEQSRFYHAAAASGGAVYLFGGRTFSDGQAPDHSHSMMKYDPVANAWTSRPGIPTPAGLSWHGWSNATGVGRDGRVYQFGGVRYTDLDLDPPGTVDGSCWSYDIAAMTWSALPSLPQAVEQARAVVIGSTVHLMGGLAVGNSPSTGNHRMDLAAGSPTWIAQAPIPSGTYAHQFGEIDGAIYLAGGMTVNPAGVNVPTTVSRKYSPGTDTWSPCAAMPSIRYSGVAGSIAGRLYVAGGTTVGSAMVTLEYDPVVNTWMSRGPCIGFTGTQAAVAARNGIPRLYVAGGFLSLADCHEYTPPLPPLAPVGLYMRRPDGSPIGEGGWAADVVELGAVVEDPNAGDTVALQVEVAVAGSSSWAAAATAPPVAAGASPATVGVSVTFPMAGLWTWRCRGRDSGGKTGPWSLFGDPNSGDVNIDLVPPAAPQPTFPLNEDVNVASQDLDGGIVQFTWNPAVDNSPLPVSYEIEVSGPAAAFQSVSGTSVGIWLPVSRYQYSWRVRAIDFAGNVGEWCIPHAFFVYVDDRIDHGSGDARRVCGGSAPLSSPGFAGFALLLAAVIRRRK